MCLGVPKQANAPVGRNTDIPAGIRFQEQEGFAALEQLLVENGITELLDPARINVALKN